MNSVARPSVAVCVQWITVHQLQQFTLKIQGSTHLEKTLRKMPIDSYTVMRPNISLGCMGKSI